MIPVAWGQFIRYYRDEAKKIDSIYKGCLVREKQGPYYSDSVYIVSLDTDGRILIHAKDMSLSARKLKPEVYEAILSGLGVSDNELASLGSSDPEPDGSFSVGNDAGHAVAFSSIRGRITILLAGFDLTEKYLISFDEEDINYGEPTIQAKNVDDADSLKLFVTEAAKWMYQAVQSDPGARSKVRLALRDPNGPWRYGSVYLYAYDPLTGQTIFNGGFPDKYEFLGTGINRDTVTNRLVWEMVEEAANSVERDEYGLEGGLLEYHFDNPNDDSDEPVRKVGYARTVDVPLTLPNGRTITNKFIIGSGFYPSEVAAAEQLKQASLKGWNVRFGRTVAQQVVDTLQNRFVASPQAGLDLTVAGERLNGTTPLEDNHELFSKLLGFETVTPYQLAQGSSFSFSPSDSGAPVQLSFWGTGALSSFSGSEDKLSVEGDVTTAMVGADWSGARWHAGAALTRSWGSGSYDGTQGNDGDLTATLTGVFPYGRYALTPRLGMWATAGYGRGELSFKPGGGAEYKPWHHPHHGGCRYRRRAPGRRQRRHQPQRHCRCADAQDHLGRSGRAGLLGRQHFPLPAWVGSRTALPPGQRCFPHPLGGNGPPARQR